MNLVLFGIGALVGGAITWGLWSLLPETWRAARWPVTIVGALMVGLNVATKVELPPAGGAVERELLSNPATREMAQAWQGADPEGFAAFAESSRDVAADGSLVAAVEYASRGLGGAVVERLPFMSDADIVALVRNTRDTLLMFADFAPHACFAIGNGQSPNLSEQQIRNMPIAGRQLGERRLELFAAAFRADTESNPEVMSAADLNVALMDIGDQMRITIPEADMALLSASAAELVGRERRYCEVMAEYENQLSLHTRAGPLYRGLLLMAQD